jgi:hypothetical protein
LLDLPSQPPFFDPSYKRHANGCFRFCEFFLSRGLVRRNPEEPTVLIFVLSEAAVAIQDS